MKTLEEIKLILQLNKKRVMEKYGLKSIALFGSYARNEINEFSDVDLLVEFDRPIGLDFVLLGDELEDILNIKVDIVTPQAIKPKMFEYIKRDLVYV